ncbi:MAG: tetratricopeptide repeat protein [Planctomycetota bacterium]|jgi:tetratricopeptide (TPR) repeat protein
MDKLQNKSWVPWFYVALILATLAIYWQVHSHSFVNYDDPTYVSKNQNIQSGITWESVKWAFTTGHAGNWHPLTWISHVLDWQLFGASAGWHHLTSLFLHIANTLLLFAVLKRMTNALWKSAFVAALFALHPLHAEFWMLTMAAYLRYVEYPGLGRYLLTLSLFALGLMAKPMLVTLPFVLLLLDYWPLRRFQFGQTVEGFGWQKPKSADVSSPWKIFCRLVLEKIPFFILSAISSVVTFLVQRSAGVVTSIERLPLTVRVANVLVSYFTYIQKMIWPSRLAMFYPYPDKTKLLWQAVAFAPLLVIISVAVVLLMHRRKYLFTGWLWYLGTLVPVVGLVQVGGQAYADRYTYVPLIGLFIIIAWGVPDVLPKRRSLKPVLGASAVAVLLALSICAHQQQRYWRDTITLCEHALDVTDPNRNYVAHFCMTEDLLHRGEIDKAIYHNQKSLEIKPNYFKALGGLAVAFARKGRTDLAVDCYKEGIRCKGDWVLPLNNLAWIQATHSQARFRNPREAMEHALRACELTKYKNPSVLDTLAAAYAAAGRFSDAVATAEKAVELSPSSNKELAERIQNRLGLYRAGRPYIGRPVDVSSETHE